MRVLLDPHSFLRFTMGTEKLPIISGDSGLDAYGVQRHL